MGLKSFFKTGHYNTLDAPIQVRNANSTEERSRVDSIEKMFGHDAEHYYLRHELKNHTFKELRVVGHKKNGNKYIQVFENQNIHPTFEYRIPNDGDINRAATSYSHEHNMIEIIIPIQTGKWTHQLFGK